MKKSTNSNSLSFLLVSILVQGGAARRWQDIVDHKIYLQPALDVARYQLMTESDPFYVPDIDTAASPDLPEKEVWVTSSPTPSPSARPSGMPSDMPSLSPTGPTSEPTTREQNIAENGGCNEGTFLYQVNMYDAWGDGWSSTSILTITGVEDEDTYEVSGTTVTQTHQTNDGKMQVSISKTIQITSSMFNTDIVEKTPIDPLGLVFQGGLLRGSHSSADVCLMPKRCYEVIMNGDNDYLNEISWDIRPVALGENEQTSTPVITGGAPTLCKFSLPDENGEHFCEGNCKQLDPGVTLAPKNATSTTQAEPLLMPAEGEQASTRSVPGGAGNLLNYLEQSRGKGQ